MRELNRQFNQLRDIIITPNYNKYAEGSCLISYGNTVVHCTASVEQQVPHFLKGKKTGWLTAEYSMLPRATHSRTKRESNTGRSGRTFEIQRLISRSLRASIDLKKIPEMQLIIDCDVLQADGGTRTASITGAYVAAHIALDKLVINKTIAHSPFHSQVAGVSCGILDGEVILDLDYIEDSNAEVDANFIINSNQQLIEVQATSEKTAFNKEQLFKMLELAEDACKELFKLQLDCINKA
jgi:ribonuclease PH